MDIATNAGNTDGDTPLHVACEWGYLDICLLLLEQQGCAIEATNARGHTPLSLAVRHSRLFFFSRGPHTKQEKKLSGNRHIIELDA